MRESQHVAVIGGGYAGMAAAVTLAGGGVRATVFDTGAALGGRARRVRAHGRALDNGQHLLVGAYSELSRLMREVGTPADAVLRLPLELRYASDFALRALWWPAPLGLLGGLLAARGVPFAERLGAVRFMLALRRARFRVVPDCPVDALLAHHAQDGRIGQFLWRPLCIAALNTPTHLASAQVFANVLRDSLAGGEGASDLLLPRVDLTRLFPEPAAQFVRARGGAIRAPHRVRVITPALAVDGEPFSRVILAVGPHQLAPFAALVGTLPAFTYQPIATCYLQYPRPVRLAFPMLGLADTLVQWVFDCGALQGAAGRLACVISAQGEHQQMPHGELAGRCHRDVSRAIGGLPEPEWSQVIVEKRATITCAHGLQRCGPRTLTPGLFLAGDHTDPEYPPTLEAAVRSGVRAAQLAMETR